MCAVRRVSMFYGGGYYDDEEQTSATTKPAEDNFSKEGWCPLCGDPLGDRIAEARILAAEDGYSAEEFGEKVQRGAEVHLICFNKKEIRIDGNVLEGLTPSLRAFYILLLRHPEGLTPNRLEEYDDEYRGIYLSLEGKRKQRKDRYGKPLEPSFQLDRRAFRYRDDIHKALDNLEKRTGMDLSGYKIFGKGRWRILNSNGFFMGNDSHIEL